jgi:hypothetical protein
MPDRKSAKEKALARVAARKKSSTGRKMMRRKFKNPTVRPGMQFGDLEILQRVPTPSGSSGGQRWRVECSCGTRLTIPQFYLVRKEHPKTHCGCGKREAIGYTRERSIFYMMHRRCYNPTHVAYPHYGGANPPIGVGDSWNKDKIGNEQAWENFIRDMGPAPTKGHTLDRINPYKGYGWQPGPDGVTPTLNCRWATATEQMNNLKRHWKKPEEIEARSKTESFKDAGGTDEDEDDVEE